jgi:hypothetical protein
MIPEFVPDTGNLPPGVHQATWQEVTSRFGHTPHRRRLWDGLQRVLLSLQSAGCHRAYVDGSFVSGKAHPNDFDGCWEIEGVDIDRLEFIAPTLLDFEDRRKAQKAAYGGEMFPARWGADPSGTAFLDFFQRDKITGEPKGIIAIDLKDFP